MVLARNLRLRDAAIDGEVEVDPALEARIDAGLVQALLLGALDAGPAGGTGQDAQSWGFSEVDGALDP